MLARRRKVVGRDGRRRGRGAAPAPGARDSGSGAPLQAADSLTVREAARILEVSTATVYKLCARGELRHVKVLNVIRIPAGTVRNLKLQNS